MWFKLLISLYDSGLEDPTRSGLQLIAYLDDIVVEYIQYARLVDSLYVLLAHNLYTPSSNPPSHTFPSKRSFNNNVFPSLVPVKLYPFSRL